LVLVDESAEKIAAAQVLGRGRLTEGDRVAAIGWQEVERAMRSVFVVCAGINRHGEGEGELYIEGVAIRGGPE
jgi:hypothetical protein